MAPPRYSLFMGILSFFSTTSLVQVILVPHVDPGNSLLGCSCPIHCRNGGQSDHFQAQVGYHCSQSQSVVYFYLNVYLHLECANKGSETKEDERAHTTYYMYFIQQQIYSGYPPCPDTDQRPWRQRIRSEWF